MKEKPNTPQRTQVRAGENRRWRAALQAAQRRIRALGEEREAARHEMAELRRLVAEHDGQLRELTAKVELLTNREQELRAMLLSSHDQLMRRADTIKATLAAELQRPASQAPEPRPVPEIPAEIRPTEQEPATGAGYQKLSKHLGYRRLVARIREVVGTALPPEATVAVVSKGDEELLQLGGGRRAWHFPQDEEGIYAGYYPADSTGAVLHLEELRQRGAEFLLFPGTALWWLERYGEFREHLDGYYRRVWGDEVCVIYGLSEKRPSGGVGER